MDAGWSMLGQEARGSSDYSPQGSATSAGQHSTGEPTAWSWEIRAASAWWRLLRKYLGIRKLRVLWNAIGTALQDYEREARDRVASVYPRR